MRRLLCTFVLLSAACQSAPYCLDCTDLATDMLYVEPVDQSMPSDLTDAADPHPCYPSTIDTDPYNCGGCGNVCSHDHAIPACVGGVCTIKSCDVGWVNLDTLVSNDCEYHCLATGAETCDQIDNDCNGIVDDGFDLMSDTQNCGMCGNTCVSVNAVATCGNGTCATGGCIPGYADLDPAVAGCEYHCPVYPPLAFEICNGLDDNCDGQVDEAIHLEAPPMGLCNTSAGTPCAGTTTTCQTRNAITTWYCNYGAHVEFDTSLPNGIVSQESKCDGFDGDCDGNVDDTFPSLGNTCDNGLVGACRDVGAIKCDPTDDSKTRCDLSVLPDAVPGAPSAELCNNIDDDCDGSIDEHTGAVRLVQDMVHIKFGANDFYIDRYEASHPDATASSVGLVTTRSCSKANAQPWTQVTFANASAACAADGLRLCTAAEWSAACEGVSNSTFPYGNTYQGSSCNGADFAATHSVLPTGDPSLAMCATPTGVHDLSGNVKEWTNDNQGMTTDTPPQTIYTTRGGEYGSPSVGLTCATTFAQAAAGDSLPGLGFRCCSSTAP